MRKNNKKRIFFLLMVLLLVSLFSVNALAGKAKAPSRTTLTKVSAPAANKVTLRWKKVPRATSYKIYSRGQRAKRTCLHVHLATAARV